MDPEVQVGQNRRSVTMGEIRASVTLENRDDRGAVQLGLRSEADVRRATVEGVVDTGAVSLVIPDEIARQLGLQHWGTRTVVYADERREQRPVTDVTIEIGNLATRTEAIVGPAGSEVLIGQLVLEALDLIADCRRERWRRAIRKGRSSPSAKPHPRDKGNEPGQSDPVADGGGQPAAALVHRLGQLMADAGVHPGPMPLTSRVPSLNWNLLGFRSRARADFPSRPSCPPPSPARSEPASGRWPDGYGRPSPAGRPRERCVSPSRCRSGARQRLTRRSQTRSRATATRMSA